MEYKGRYGFFDAGKIQTYPVSTRTNKVKLKDLVGPDAAMKMKFDLPPKTASMIEVLAEKLIDLRRAGKPVMFFTGAHLIKNGLGPLVADLVNRDMLTIVSGNGATCIHDFELALMGETSEYVPQALEKGQFGMAYEFGYINTALSIGNKYKLGYGETLGKMICEKSFFDEVLAKIGRADSPKDFKHPNMSVLAACYLKKVPFTAHVGVGVDVIDQHESFDGQAKGGCSGRDFLIYTHETCRLADGGMVLNIGSAVTGAEVLLKAVSMAANVGCVPKGIITADFDLRLFDPEQARDESKQGYYFRDQKSVVTRIPEAFGGEGYYVQGNQRETIPYLYQCIMKKI
jgi:hypothetical protein